MLGVLGLIAAGASILGGVLTTAGTIGMSRAQEVQALEQERLAREQAAQVRKEAEWRVQDLQTQQNRKFLRSLTQMLGGKKTALYKTSKPVDKLR